MMVRLTLTILVLVMLLVSLGGCSKSNGNITIPGSAEGDARDVSGGFKGLGDNDIIIKAAYNTVKIRRDADPSKFRDDIPIRSAKNEHEAFQIIPLPGAGTTLTGVQVSVTDLTGPGGAVFSSQNFTYYLEGYIYISTPSDAGGSTGWYPDPLIPISNPFSIDTSVGLQPVWIDCYVPASTPTGDYTGSVEVSAIGGLWESIPIYLKVLPLTLSDHKTLKTAFGVHKEVISSYHGLPVGDVGPETMAMRLQYAEMLLDRGISFYGLNWFNVPYVVNADDTVTIDFTKVQSKVDEFLLGGSYSMSTFQFPLREWDMTGRLAAGTSMGSAVWRKRMKSYIQGLTDFFISNNVLDRTYVYLVDEPDSYSAYENIRYLGSLIQEVNPRPKFMVTEQAYSWNYNSWGSLLGYVDIFCPLVSWMYPSSTYDPADPYFDGIYEYDQWVYTNSNLDPYPGYAIDHSALEPRLMAWLAYQQGIDCILYWSVNYWKQQNPWDNPFTFNSTEYGAGNGSFLYPGMFISQHSDQQDIDGPIPSIRLEQVREGIEDYEYFMAIAGGAPIPQLDYIMKDMDDFITNGVQFYRYRNIGIDVFF